MKAFFAKFTVAEIAIFATALVFVTVAGLALGFGPIGFIGFIAGAGTYALLK